MHWQLNAYAAFLIVSATISGAVAIYAWRRRPTPGAIPLALFMLAATEWALSYALELGSLELAPKIFWAKVQYFGIAAAPPLLLIFVLQYLRQERWLKGRVLALLAIPSVSVLLLAWTNELHGLIWSATSLKSDGPFPLLILEHGTFFWVFLAYSYTCVAISTVLLVRARWYSSHLHQAQVNVILAGTLVPWVASLAYVFGTGPFSLLDLTPFAFTISGVVATWGLFRFQLLDLVPTARYRVVENMAGGVIVLDKQGQIVDINPAAQRLVGCTMAEVIGRPVREVLAEWPDFIERYHDAQDARGQITLGQGEARQFYDLSVSPLHDRRGRLTGRVLVLHDTTALKQAEETLTRLLGLSQALVATRDVTKALRQAALSAVAIVQAADRCTLQWLDEEGRSLQTVALSDAEGVPADLPVFAVGEGVAGHTLASRQVINVPDVLEDERFVAGGVAPQFRSLLVTPLLVQDRALGTLSLSSRQVGAFSAQDEILSRLMADQVAAVLDNAHEFSARMQAEETLQRYTERLQILHEIDQSIQAARHPENIAVAAISRIRRLIPCQRVLILAVEPSGEIRLLAARSSGSLGSVSDVERYREVLEGQVFHSFWIQGIGDLAERPQRTPLQQALYEEGVRAYAILPLFIQNELVGTLNLESTQANAFTADHIDVANEVAVSLAVAIRQVRLYDQAQQQLAERMRAEARMRQYAAELEAHNAELDAFAHTVAHDLKNPVSTVLGYTQLLVHRRSQLTEELVREALAAVERTAVKMRVIIDELLLLSIVRGTEGLEMSPLDMAAIVSEVQKRLSYLVDEYQAEIVTPDSWPTPLGHGPWIEEVWVNYVSNALKYGGRPPRVELGYERSNGQRPSIRFWVRDNGPGLQPEQIASLFAPFERLHQVRIEGHGLGLSIVERIVRKLGGEVGVESEGISGQGSTFFFTLPAAAVDKD